MAWSDASGLKDLGERVIPDAVNADDWVAAKLLEQHLARYEMASRSVVDRDVLDVACGSGYGSLAMALAGARHVTAADIDEAVVRYARRRYSHPNIAFRCCDVDTIKDAYDIVTCFETLEHVGDPKGFLEALRKRLRPNGMLMVSATTVETKDIYPFHLHDFTIESFERLCTSAGFNILERRCSSFLATAAQVRASMREHFVLPRPATVLSNPFRAARNIANACLFRGLNYENWVLTACLG